MKRILAILLLLMILCGCAQAEDGTVLRLHGATDYSPEAIQLQQNHPGVRIEAVSNIFHSMDAMLNQMVAHDFPYDGYQLISTIMHVQSFIDKGYCLDLSGYSDLVAEVEKMQPALQNLVMKDGKLYAVPLYMTISYWAYDPEAWAAAGLTEEDVPSSFDEMLDFLDRWADFATENEIYHIKVMDSFDEEFYGPQSYINTLTRLLIENHMMYTEYYGEELKFDTGVFRGLLRKCAEVGRKLYECEVMGEGEYALFWKGNDISSLMNIVPLRIRDDQEPIVKAQAQVYAIYPTSDLADLTAEYIGLRLANLEPVDQSVMYRGQGAVESAGVLIEISELQEEIEEQETYLTVHRGEMEEDEIKDFETSILQLKEEKEKLEDSDRRWDVSEEEIQYYQTYGERLYFQPPTVFDPNTEDGQKVYHYVDMFSYGQIDEEMLIHRLDELAWMIASEKE